MKKIANFTKTIVLALISAIILCTTINTSAVASTIQIGDAQLLDGYVGNVQLNIKTTTDSKYVYCLDMGKKTAKNITAKLVGEKDAGLAYLITNGYPNKSFTGDKLKDYYITQTAIWWYLDNTTGSTNLTSNFRETGADPYNLRPTIKSLVAKAEAAKKAGYAKTTLSLSAKNYNMTLKDNYYISEEIYATSYSNISSYTVTATGAKNIQIINEAGKTTSTIGVKEKFRIKVPVSSVSGTSLTIALKAEAEGIVYKAYEYQPTNTEMQAVTVATPEKQSVNVTAKLSLTIDSSKVSIVKIDSKTKNAIAGATLVVKDSAGNVVTSWTSTTNYHVIRNLKNGTYTVTETKAPEGYILNSEPVTFTVSSTARDIKVEVENTARKSVVNIVKIDASTDEALPGAMLVVKDSTGKVIAEFTSTTKPYILTDLANGTYTVEEITAPAGYKKSDEIKSFTITDDNLSHQITFENHPEVIVPDTASSSWIFSLLGIVIIASGIGYIYKNAKKAR